MIVDCVCFCAKQWYGNANTAVLDSYRSDLSQSVGDGCCWSPHLLIASSTSTSRCVCVVGSDVFLIFQKNHETYESASVRNFQKRLTGTHKANKQLPGGRSGRRRRHLGLRS
jgi:hypothetical protein